MRNRAFLFRVKKHTNLRDPNVSVIGLAFLAAGVLGILLALMITREIWLLAIAIVCAVPVAILFLRYPLVAAIAWFLLMPLLPFDTVPRQAFWIVHRALMPLGMGTALLLRMLRVRRLEPVRFGWAELAMAIYLVIGAVSVLTTQAEPLPYLLELSNIVLVPFAAYWLVRLVAPREQDFRRLVPIVVFVCIVEIGVGFLAKYAPSGLPALWDITRDDPMRMSGTFRNPTPYAHALVFCMVFIFHDAMQRPKGLVRTAMILLFGAGLACVFLTFTRGCWIAAVLVLLGLLYAYPKPVLSLSAVAVPIAIVLSTTVFTNEVETAISRLVTQDTVNSRIVLANAGERMFYARPIWGWGFASYDRYDWKFMQRVGTAAPTLWDVQHGTSHNTYLTILAEMGAVGFFFQFFPLLWCIFRTRRAWTRAPRHGFWSRRLLIVMWLPIVFYLVSSQVVDMRFFWFNIGLLWLNLGLVASTVESMGKNAATPVPVTPQARAD
jgi:O-antigen ligase